MGYMRHHLIAVSTFEKERAIGVHLKALEIFKDTWQTKFSRMVGDIVVSPINDEYTFIIYPDGSKEGWDVSDTGDTYRAELISYIESMRYEDGSNAIGYAEMFYRDDENESEVVCHN